MPVRKYNPDDNIYVWKPKNFDWTIEEKSIIKEDLKDTYNNVEAYKKTLRDLMEMILMLHFK